MNSDTLKVLWAAKTKYPKNWGIKSHSHDCYQLFFIQSGSCHYTIDGKETEVFKDDYILILPNIQHSMQKNHNSMVRMIDIKFKLNGHDLVDKVKSIQSVGSASDTMRYFYKLISNEIKSQGEYYKEMVETFTYLLILKLIASSKKIEKTEIITELDEQGWSHVCCDLARYLEANYSDKVTLEGISDSLGYNKNYLCTLFKDETTYTIMDYLKRVRIERTCELIEMSDYTFSQICYMVGFKSVHHFNRIFKEIMKITPSEYKTSVKERSSAVIQDTFRNVDNYDKL